MRTPPRFRALGAALATVVVVLVCLGFATSDAARIADPNTRLSAPRTAALGSTASHTASEREATLTSTPRARPAQQHETLNWTVFAACAAVLAGAGWILCRRHVVSGLAWSRRQLRLRGPPLLHSV